MSQALFIGKWKVDRKSTDTGPGNLCLSWSPRWGSSGHLLRPASFGTNLTPGHHFKTLQNLPSSLVFMLFWGMGFFKFHLPGIRKSLGRPWLVTISFWPLTTLQRHTVSLLSWFSWDHLHLKRCSSGPNACCCHIFCRVNSSPYFSDTI